MEQEIANIYSQTNDVYTPGLINTKQLITEVENGIKELKDDNPEFRDSTKSKWENVVEQVKIKLNSVEGEEKSEIEKVLKIAEDNLENYNEYLLELEKFEEVLNEYKEKQRIYEKKIYDISIEGLREKFLKKFEGEDSDEEILI